MSFTIQDQRRYDDDDNDDDSVGISEHTHQNLSGEELREMERMRELTNPGYHKIYKSYKNKSMKISMYATRNNIGSRIRDPIRGSFSSDRVGTKAEYYYFKVRLVSIASHTNEPVTLYYDSPESYERHQYMRVNTDTKNRWHERREAFTGHSIPRLDGNTTTVS
jgi:hypothetical protein